jgi:hypothetical protein
MPRVPDLLTRDRDTTDLGIGDQSMFASSNRLWTPDMDKKPPTLAEQEIEASRQRTAGMFDWLTGPRGGAAKPTPEPSPKTINYGAAAPLGQYPSDVDAEFAKSMGMGYGTVHEPYIDNQTARVYGEVRMVNQPKVKGKDVPSKAVFYADTGAGQTVSGIMNTINQHSTDIDLTKPEFKEVRNRIGNAYTKAAMAVEANSIAKLGYDPKLVVSDVSDVKTNLSGAYRRPPKEKEGTYDVRGAEGGEAIYANLTDPSVLVHESIHRGVRLLEKNPEAKALLDKLPDAGGHEWLVRYMMYKHAGDPEQITPSGKPDQQRKSAVEYFEDKYWGKQHQATVNRLMEIAAQEVAKKRPGGPR